MNYRDFVSNFLKLTQWTVPFGTEKHFVEHILEPILGFQLKFDGMNFYHTIGDNPDTLFCCHLDTASSVVKKVEHGIMENIIYSNGDTILGADDKAGLMVMLSLIEKRVPGLYYFFSGEESGRIGSIYARDNFLDRFNVLKKAIAWDRRDKSSIITHQMCGRCCSDEFADEVSLAFKRHGLWFEGDSGGIYTDTATFTGIIPECTNLSIGYHGEHGPNEYIDILYAYSVAKASVKIDWSSIKTHDYDEDDDQFNSWYYGRYSKIRHKKTSNKFDSDKIWDYLNNPPPGSENYRPSERKAIEVFSGDNESWGVI